MIINLDKVKIWAESDLLDDEFEEIEDDDPDGFEQKMWQICDIRQLLIFASNRQSTKRSYFAKLLVEKLCWIYYSHGSLPWHFSRRGGLISAKDFKNQALSQAEKIYEYCEVIEEMRNSNLDEIKKLANLILDFRHEYSLIAYEDVRKFRHNLASTVEANFPSNM